MRKKCVVGKEDYERYSIFVPVSVLMRFNRRRYIFSELEKLHPCFSDDFCFDAKERLSKGKLCSDVVVMNKYKLSEYKERFPNQKIFLDTKRKVFDGGNTRKIRFVLSLLLIIACSLCFLFFWKKNIEKVENEIQNEFITEVKIEEPVENYRLVEELFETIRREKGKIEFLEWKRDALYEDCIVSVNFLYPEQITSVKGIKSISSIKNQESKNNFTAHLKNKMVTENKKIGDTEIDRKKLRNLFQKSGFLIVEENFEPISFKFMNDKGVTNGKSFLFTKLGELADSENFGIQKVLLKGGKENDLTGEITFTGDYVNGECFDIRKIDEYLDLFAEGDLFLEKKQSEIKMEKLSVPGNKVGEIRKDNGKVVTFYKDKSGKILKVEN